MKHGEPFAGPAGYVLEEELKRLGWKFSDFRITNLWPHPKPDLKGKGAAALAALDSSRRFHARRLSAEITGKRGVLLLGSDVVSYYLNAPVGDVSGLVLTDVFARKIVVPTYNPAALLQEDSVAGEFRHALEVFHATMAKK
jgi:uracil-DNA glycosylase family 4